MAVRTAYHTSSEQDEERPPNEVWIRKYQQGEMDFISGRTCRVLSERGMPSGTPPPANARQAQR